MQIVLNRLAERFEAARDPERASAAKKYMRNRFSFYGISSPALRAISREVLVDQPAPDESALRAIARGCWGREEREWQYFACGYLRMNVRHASPRFLSTIRMLITKKSWWDTVDTLAAHTLGSLVAAHPSLVSAMDDWIESDNFWLARSAILHQLTYKEHTDADRLFAYCLRRSSDTEFFIRKSIGWALREYSRTDPFAVETFVERNDARLSGLSKREALKRIERGKTASRARS